MSITRRTENQVMPVEVVDFVCERPRCPTQGGKRATVRQNFMLVHGEHVAMKGPTPPGWVIVVRLRQDGVLVERELCDDCVQIVFFGG